MIRTSSSSGNEAIGAGVKGWCACCVLPVSKVRYERIDDLGVVEAGGFRHEASRKAYYECLRYRILSTVEVSA